jgi:C4-dicarboxylate transporter DctM subunit
MARWTGLPARGSMTTSEYPGRKHLIGGPSTVAEGEPSAGGIVGPVLLDRLALCIEALVVITIFANIVLTFVNAVVRYLTNQDFPWATDTWAIMISVITFLGAPAYFRRGAGMAYTALIDQSHGLRKQVLQSCGLAIFLGVCLVALAAYPSFLASQLTQSLQVLGISSAFVAMWFGIGMLLFCIFVIEKLAMFEPRAVVAGVAVGLAMAVVTLALRWAYDQDLIAIDPFIPIVPALIVGFLTGAPIAGILALAGILYFVITGEAPITTVASAMQYGVSSFVLLAVPFFMVAGTLMEVTGMARRMIDMVQEWVGHWTGGLLVAEVVAMYVFSGLSGSKAADIATVGGVMKTPLRHYGYPPTESVAVLAASAAMGETIPPSLMLLVLGSITSLSVGSLFLAGLLPAAILALVLIGAVIVRSHMHGYVKGPPFRIGRALRSTPPAIPAFLVPVIVVGGIIGGIASPTESATFAVVYGFAAALVVYRAIGLHSAWTALRDAALTAGMVLFMVAASNLVSQAIVIDGLGRTLAQAFASLHNPTIFLVLTVVVMIVVGFILEGIPAILIAAPILLPIATRVGVDPLQYGIVLTMAVGIGVFLPPVGIGYYIACAIGEAPVNATMRPSLIYSAFLVVGLAIVVLLPAITTSVPHFFGMH